MAAGTNRLLYLNIRALSTHKKHETFCIANRSASRERVVQGNLSQFNSLDLALPWFVARRSIQRSYGRADTLFTFSRLAQFLARFQPRVSPHSHAINSRWISKNCLHVRASSAAARDAGASLVSNSLLKRSQQLSFFNFSCD